MQQNPILAALCDELAFWRSDEDSASPDVETIAALKPALSTIPESMLLCLSSPYSRRGALWEAYKRHYGRDGDVLVWRADTCTMNPTVSQAIIEQAYQEDSARATSEYGGEFRSDIESFVSREVVDAAIVHDRYELPYAPNTVYRAFCDPSGGSADSFTLAIAHQEGNVVVLDAIRERRPPFSPDDVCREFAGLIRAYGLSEVCGDKYAGMWPCERFQAHDVHYRAAQKTKSEIYGETLPLLNAGRVELLDHPRLVAQLCSLERRTSRAGKDSIDHPPYGHDDVCNAACGALLLARSGVRISDDMILFGERQDYPAQVHLNTENYTITMELLR